MLGLLRPLAKCRPNAIDKRPLHRGVGRVEAPSRLFKVSYSFSTVASGKQQEPSLPGKTLPRASIHGARREPQQQEDKDRLVARESQPDERRRYERRDNYDDERPRYADRNGGGGRGRDYGGRGDRDYGDRRNNLSSGARDYRRRDRDDGFQEPQRDNNKDIDSGRRRDTDNGDRRWREEGPRDRGARRGGDRRPAFRQNDRMGDRDIKRDRGNFKERSYDGPGRRDRDSERKPAKREEPLPQRENEPRVARFREKVVTTTAEGSQDAAPTASVAPKQRIADFIAKDGSAANAHVKPAETPTKTVGNAINELRARVEQNQSDLDARFDLTLLLMRNLKTIPEDNYTKVATTLNEINKGLAEVIGNQVYLQQLTQKLTSRLSAIQRADLAHRISEALPRIAKNPTQVTNYIDVAQYHLLGTDFTRAQQYLASAVKLAAADSAFADGVKAEYDEKDLTKAEELYGTALELNPDHSAAYTNMGIITFYAKKNVTEALRLFQEAIRSDYGKKNWAAHYHLGFLHEIELEDTEKAKMEYSKTLEINPKHYQTHTHLGSLLMNDNLFEFALSHYKRAVKLAPTKQLIYYNLANCLSRMGLMDEAILWSKKAVELDKTDPEPHYHMGNIYLNHKMIIEAIKCYKACIELIEANPESTFDPAPVINNLVVTLRRGANQIIQKSKHASDFLRASEYLAQAIELANVENPELVAIQRLNLAYCYMKCGLPRKAIEQMELAVSSTSDQFLDDFREVKKDKYGEEVIEQLDYHMSDGVEVLPANTPDRARAHYNAAFCLFHMGEVLAAQGHLEEALEHDPAVISDYVDQDISSKDANDILSDDQPEAGPDDEFDDDELDDEDDEDFDNEHDEVDYGEEDELGEQPRRKKGKAEFGVSPHLLKKAMEKPTPQRVIKAYGTVESLAKLAMQKNLELPEELVADVEEQDAADEVEEKKPKKVLKTKKTSGLKKKSVTSKKSASKAEQEELAEKGYDENDEGSSKTKQMTSKLLQLAKSIKIPMTDVEKELSDGKISLYWPDTIKMTSEQAELGRQFADLIRAHIDPTDTDPIEGLEDVGEGEHIEWDEDYARATQKKRAEREAKQLRIKAKMKKNKKARRLYAKLKEKESREAERSQRGESMGASSTTTETTFQ